MSDNQQLTTLVHVRFDPKVRAHPPERRYMAIAHWQGGEARWTLCLEFLGGGGEPTWETFAWADFLVHDAPHEVLQKGQRLELLEGPFVVGTVDVLAASARIRPSNIVDVRHAERGDAHRRKKEAA